VMDQFYIPVHITEYIFVRFNLTMG
jgi:hypothetical protein